MASKFIKTMAMAGMCILATTGMSLAGSTVNGWVENDLFDGDDMMNLSIGNDNKASIASINLKDSKVTSSGTVLNSVAKVDHVVNGVLGDDNKASIASINMEDSKVKGDVYNYVYDRIENSGNAVLLGNGNTTGTIDRNASGSTKSSSPS